MDMMETMIELMRMMLFPMMKGMLTDIPATIEMILPICNPEALCGLSRWLCAPGVLSELISLMKGAIMSMMGAMK